MNRDWLSFRELDERASCPKGEAFRAFRRLEAAWREGEDFVQLRAETAAVEIDALRALGRVYRSSPHVVLVAPQRVGQLLAALGARGSSAAPATLDQQ